MTISREPEVEDVDAMVSRLRDLGVADVPAPSTVTEVLPNGHLVVIGEKHMDREAISGLLRG